MDNTVNRKAFVLLAFLCMLAMAGPSYAGQEESSPSGNADLLNLSLEELMQLEITSSARRPQPLNRATTAMFVITAEEIRQAGPVRIEELLRLVPGMDVFCTDGVTTVSGSRGFIKWNNQRMQILLDGRPLYDPYLGGALLFLHPIFLENIERIEVIRGSAGVAWGVNAMNGVINIVTKKAVDTQGGFVYGALGSRELQQGYGRYGGTQGPLTWRGTAGGFHDSGFGPDEPDVYHDNYTPFQADGRADVKLREDTTLSFTGGHKASSYEGHTTLGAYSIQYTNLLLEKKVNDHSSWQMRWTEDFISRTHNWNVVDIRSREEMLELQHNWVWNRHNVVWGADYTRDVYESTQRGAVANTIPADFANDQVSAFVEDEITLADHVWFTLGYRGQYNELTHYDWAGRSALVWEVAPKHFLRGAISRSFRRPTMWEEFRAGPEEYGNDSLLNERMVSYEIGYRGQWRQNLSFNVEGYVNQDTDMIAKQFDASWIKRYQNVYDVKTYGIETSVDWKPAPWWLVRGFHVYMHQTDRDRLTNWRTGETQVHLGPKHRVGLTNRFYLDEATTLNTQLYWTDASTSYPEYIPGKPFWKLDVRLARRLWKDKAEVAVGVTNLTDAFHYEGGYDWSTGQYIEVPRMLYAQFFCRF